MPAVSKDTWLRILLHSFTAMISASFGAGVTVTALNGRINNVESRVTAIEVSRPENTAWRVDQNEKTITAVQLRSDRFQADVSTINSRLAGIDVKLDLIAEALKAHH